MRTIRLKDEKEFNAWYLANLAMLRRIFPADTFCRFHIFCIATGPHGLRFRDNGKSYWVVVGPTPYERDMAEAGIHDPHFA